MRDIEASRSAVAIGLRGGGGRRGAGGLGRGGCARRWCSTVHRRRGHRLVRRRGVRRGRYRAAARGRGQRLGGGDVRLPAHQGRRRGARADLRDFCDGSVAMLAWLEGHGVPSRAACARTSVLPHEPALPALLRQESRPATSPRPRRAGTRPGGGEPRAAPDARLARAARQAHPGPARRRRRELVTAGGRVTVECRSLRGAPGRARAAHRRAPGASSPDAPKLGGAGLHRPVGRPQGCTPRSPPSGPSAP